jgi:hypothetical protein
MVSPKHFSGALCGKRGAEITVNRPTCPECLARLEQSKEPTNAA